MLVTIKDSKTTATIDSLGAQLISLKDTQGKEYIWQRDPKIWSKCSPLLFPIVGNLRNGKTVIQGTTYQIPKHGFCKDTDFTLSGQSGTQATFEMEDSESTRKTYPYAFRLALTYRLEEGQLSMDYLVENKDDKTIHYCIGAHPGFICPLEEGEAFTDYVLEFEQPETADRMLYDLANFQFDPSNRVRMLSQSSTLALDYQLFEHDAIYFDQLASKKVSLMNPATGKGVEVAYPDFATIAFWTPYSPQGALLCIEPWNGSGVYATEDDQFTSKHDLQTLKEGESKNYHLGIRIL